MALAVAFLPGVVFGVGLMTLAWTGVALWPHQLYYWLLGVSIVGPLVAALMVRRIWWSLGFVGMFLAVLVTAATLQMTLLHDAWDSCPGTKDPRGWETRSGESSVVRAEMTCVYVDPDTGREVDRGTYTMFDRVEDVFGTSSD